MRLAIILPALNEEGSVGSVVRRCRLLEFSSEEFRVLVADNGSTDQTREVALQNGAEVVRAPRRGYGAACLDAIKFLGEWPTLYLFIDADGSSLPEEIPRLIRPILEEGYDLVLGVRDSTSAMTLPQRFGTRLAVWLINRLWGSSYADMGPFRAIRRSAFEELEMKDRTWGWTVEMQILAMEQELRVSEVPVSWEERMAGVSKISGTLQGVLRAGGKILWTVAYYFWTLRISGARSRGGQRGSGQM